MNLLGPKTEADLQQPPPNKSDKKPKATKDSKCSSSKDTSNKDDKVNG